MIPITQLQMQYHGQPGIKAPPNVVYAHLKYMWATGAREESLDFLRKFTSSLARDLQPEAARHAANSAAKKKLDELVRQVCGGGAEGQEGNLLMPEVEEVRITTLVCADEPAFLANHVHLSLF